MAPHSSILAWKIPRAEELGWLQSMGPQRVRHDLLTNVKKIRDTKGTFHAKMGSIKDRNDMDLIEAEDIKKSGKNIQKNCTKKTFTTKIIKMV